MNNKVKFLRGTATEYEAATKDNDTFYYTTDTEKLYLGDKEITGGGVTIDDTLSDTSKNPVQNKVINAALNSKADLSDLSEHTDNAEIHVTAEEKAAWNAVNYSNPNLLINYDFKINQRGVSGTITAAGYFVDRWKLVSGEAMVNSDGTITLNGTISQVLEKAVGDNSTASASAGTASYNNSTKTFTLTATGETIAWAKLELGSIATPFVPPDPATELAKCQRYYQRIGKAKTGHFGIGYIGEKGAYSHVCTSLPTSMRTNPTVTLVGTLYITTSGHTGSASLPTSEWAGVPSTLPDQVLLPLKIGGTESIAGQGCTVQNRDGTSYIELSAEL